MSVFLNLLEFGKHLQTELNKSLPILETNPTFNLKFGSI